MIGGKYCNGAEHALAWKGMTPPLPSHLRGSPFQVPWWRVAVVAALAGGVVSLCLLTSSPAGQTTVAGVKMELPYRVGGWWGIDTAVSEAEKTILPPDTEFVRKTYESAQGDSILASIVLSGAERRSIHRPQVCLPSQGWTIKNTDVVEIPLHSGRMLRATNLTLARSARVSDSKEVEIRSYYLYWFIGDNVTTPSHAERIWLTIWDRLAHNVNHRWAYVIFNSLITQNLKPNGKSPEETLAMLKEFVADVVPTFQKTEMAPSTP